MTDHTSIAVLGTGALGAVVARAFAAAGHPTSAWNRSPDRLTALVGETPAIRPAATVAEAVSGAEVVVIAVADAAATEAVLDAAGPGLAGRTVVNLTSTTPDQTRAVAGRVGRGYLDGAAMSGTRLVGDPSALFLYAGDRATFDEAEPSLRALGVARHVGSDPGAASRWDTALLGLILSTLAGFYQAAALVGGSAAQVAEVALDHQPFITGLITDHATQIDAGRYPSDDGSLTVYQAAVEHLVTTTADSGVATDLPVALSNLITRGVAAGHADDGLASLIDVLR
jgi:3-hydroxyisobutyrate dehydrogenase-like beta-hydroxyacid dehydrogenase